MAKIRTRARAVDMLGRQQIAGTQNAINELFKNAHDAYANNVRIDFFEDEGTLLIRDDGVGMTRDDFEEKWLVLGTESKAAENRALQFRPKGAIPRSITGEKGIGRLAIALLGRQVLVLTRAAREDGLHDLVLGLVHWGLFEMPGLNLDEIEIPIKTLPGGTLPSAEQVENPEGAQCRLRSGATRLIVLGKPIGRFGTEEEEFTVKESQLASKLIDEFVAMNSGILPSYALLGLAAIRRNSKRILDRFHGDLDGAFLLHRELVATSEEAFDQLPELLAEEIRAVVEDERLSAGIAKKISVAALASDHVLRKDKELIQKFQEGTKPKNVVDKLKEAGAIPIGHLRLAELFSSRTQYLPASRKLGFGTVVRYRAKNSKKKNTPWQYAICLVPTCDSLRLKADQFAQFPFWTIEAEAFNGGSQRNGMVLAVDSAGHISLSASGKAGEKLWTDTFKVDGKTKTVIALHVKGTFKYGGTKRTIEWLGQLKPLHAHRIVHEITDSLSRVGVSEAEWLRLLCDRGR